MDFPSFSTKSRINVCQTNTQLTKGWKSRKHDKKSETFCGKTEKLKRKNCNFLFLCLPLLCDRCADIESVNSWKAIFPPPTLGIPNTCQKMPPFANNIVRHYIHIYLLICYIFFVICFFIILFVSIFNQQYLILVYARKKSHCLCHWEVFQMYFKCFILTNRIEMFRLQNGQIIT